MIDADLVRRIIIDHDAARPRSKQTAVGPSDLSSPCDRRLIYQMLGTERVVSADVNLYAYVGTGIHRQMEDACHVDNARLGRTRWITETITSVPITDTVYLTGSCDVYDTDTFTAVDWKSRGASKPSQAIRDKNHGQALAYALGLILKGWPVTHTAIVYIPRNGTLSEIEVDTRPFDHAGAEAMIRRYEALLSLAAVGPAVLPLLPVVHDCRWCGWWSPGSDDLTRGCPGQPPTSPQVEIPPWETQEEKAAQS